MQSWGVSDVGAMTAAPDGPSAAAAASHAALVVSAASPHVPSSTIQKVAGGKAGEGGGGGAIGGSGGEAGGEGGVKGDGSDGGDAKSGLEGGNGAWQKHASTVSHCTVEVDAVLKVRLPAGASKTRRCAQSAQQLGMGECRIASASSRRAQTDHSTPCSRAENTHSPGS